MSGNYETLKILGSLYSPSSDLEKRETAKVSSCLIFQACCHPGILMYYPYPDQKPGGGGVCGRGKGGGGGGGVLCKSLLYVGGILTPCSRIFMFFILFYFFIYFFFLGGGGGAKVCDTLKTVSFFSESCIS